MKNKPQYHYRPQANWINDPNGLCQVDRWYHLYFQHHPNGPLWDDMHWGHARSCDMMHWETLPIAMAPAREKGEMHCFSGSCCIGHDGQPRVYYTSIGRDEDGRGGRDGAEQWMALPSPDMATLTQTDAHALRDPAIHGGLHIQEWRDPHVIRWQDGYLMAAGGCDDGYGCVAAYTSADGYDWTFRGLMYRSAVQNGVTWECPNIFVIDGKFGLLYSPCGAVEYVIGTLDESFRLIPEHTGLIDPAAWQGFYAPQTFVDEQGHQILLGWMPECDGTDAAISCGWSGAMSLPRLMTLDDDGDLCITPLPEALAIATEWQVRQLPAGEHALSCNAAHSFLRISGTITQQLTITMQTGADEYSIIMLTPDGTLTLDRSRSCADGQPNVSDITRRVPMTGGRVDLFAAYDDTTIEYCVNGHWLSGRVDPAGNAAKLHICCSDAVEVSLCDRLETVNEDF